MGWLIETAVVWVWEETFVATHRRYGIVAALCVLALPILIIAALLSLLFWN